MSNEIKDWVLVPRVATPEMVCAGFLSKPDDSGFLVDEPMDAPSMVYRAMLAAAPTPPAEAQVVDGGAVDWDAYQIIDQFLQCANVGRHDGKLLAAAKDWVSQQDAALSAQPQPARAEDRFEQFVQAEIARSPEPLRELGEYLGRVLDEDQFPAANRLLLQLATLTPKASAPVGDCPDCTNGQQCDSCSRGERAILESSAPVGVERKYPDDGNGDDDAYNRGWNGCLDALAQQPAAVDGKVIGGGVVLPRYFLDFLLGQGALEGFWFGDTPITEQGPLWWRSRLRALAQPQGASHE